MPDSILSLMHGILEAAALIQDPPALALARSVEEYVDSPRLQVLIVGPTGSGRGSIANAVLDRPDLLPTSPLPKAPVGVLLRYGPSDALYAIGPDGARTAFPAGRLRSFLSGAPEASGEYVAVELDTPAELLKTCDLRIETLDAARTPEGWRDLLAATDFTLFVLNATALLSTLERQFVRDQLAGPFGLHRAAIIVNKMDLIPEDERESILELVHTFLGPFENQPAVLDLSTAEILAALTSGGEEPSGYRALHTLMDDLQEQRFPLREGALRQALEAAVAELAEGIERQRALLAVDQQEIDRIKRSIDARQDWLQERIERAQRRVDTFIGAALKEHLLRECEEFGVVFRRRLQDEVPQVQDIAAIRKHLPGYIETVWKEFLERQSVILRNRLLDEARLIVQLVENDLKELLGESSEALEKALKDFETEATDVHSFVMPKRGQHPASNFIRILSLYGFIVLAIPFFDPAIGIISLITSHVIRHVNKESIERADKEAIVAAANNAIREVERELYNRIEEQFGNLTRELREEVAGLYASGLARVEAFLQEHTARDQDVEARRQQLGMLAGETVPRLREMVAGLDRRVVA